MRCVVEELFLEPAETGSTEHRNASLTYSAVRSSDPVGHQAVKRVRR